MKLTIPASTKPAKTAKVKAKKNGLSDALRKRHTATVKRLTDGQKKRAKGIEAAAATLEKKKAAHKAKDQKIAQLTKLLAK